MRELNCQYIDIENAWKCKESRSNLCLLNLELFDLVTTLENTRSYYDQESSNKVENAFKKKKWGFKVWANTAFSFFLERVSNSVAEPWLDSSSHPKNGHIESEDPSEKS